MRASPSSRLGLDDEGVAHPPAGILHFTVDSALLRELGERLVGRPSIALAELIKNAYDADATAVSVQFGKDRIVIADNGIGMDYNTFRDFWMRIGTPHKQKSLTSPLFQRPLTGSKGVGRLSTQFLARQLELRTVSKDHQTLELSAGVDWPTAAAAGELTQAEASYREQKPSAPYPDGSPHGTAIELRSLNHRWTAGEYEELAREIWWLQPPFQTGSAAGFDSSAFSVSLSGASDDAIKQFSVQMRAYMSLWHARVVGRLKPLEGDTAIVGPRTVQVALEFAGDRILNQEFILQNCELAELRFEIRVFHPKYRQPYGVKVEELRNYLKQFGGVHVYDAGFRLPYYGAETDWLQIELDHSHRLSRSRLLPDEFQVPEGMNFLPTNTRLLGVVNVDTSRERQLWDKGTQGERPQFLMIQISRDRLVDNGALRSLRDSVRIALDFYAVEEARRSFEEAESVRDTEPLSEKAERIEQILERYSSEIPTGLRTTLASEVNRAVTAVETNAELLARQAGLLGALATAGMSALAYEHELGKQYLALEDIADRLKKLRADTKTTRSLFEFSKELYAWVDRAREIRSLFTSLADQAQRTNRQRFVAKSLVDQVVERMTLLLRGVQVQTSDIDAALRLPKGRFAEWSAILQNLFINSANAMLDSRRKVLQVKSINGNSTRSLIIQDTGSGVELSSSEELFKPFVRRLDISDERRALGLGGTGLGLTIVRMISLELGCQVTFRKPEAGFSTAVSISWRESA